MKSFQFPLERLMHLRAAQLAIEENKLKQVRQRLASLDGLLSQLTEQSANVERELIGRGTCTGSDLNTLAAHQRKLERDIEATARSREECQQAVVAQRERFLAARREYRLLEKLKDKRHAEWEYELNREIEALASDSYLARWHARTRST